MGSGYRHVRGRVCKSNAGWRMRGGDLSADCHANCGQAQDKRAAAREGLDVRHEATRFFN